MLQSCPTICNPMDCSLLGSYVYGILQARILEWVSMPSSRGYSKPRDQPTSADHLGRPRTPVASPNSIEQYEQVSPIFFTLPCRDATHIKLYSLWSLLFWGLSILAWKCASGRYFMFLFPSSKTIWIDSIFPDNTHHCRKLGKYRII